MNNEKEIKEIVFQRGSAKVENAFIFSLMMRFFAGVKLAYIFSRVHTQA